jgi:hypothetical protein
MLHYIPVDSSKYYLKGRVVGVAREHSQFTRRKLLPRTRMISQFDPPRFSFDLDVLCLLQHSVECENDVVGCLRLSEYRSNSIVSLGWSSIEYIVLYYIVAICFGGGNSFCSFCCWYCSFLAFSVRVVVVGSINKPVVWTVVPTQHDDRNVILFMANSEKNVWMKN